MAGGRLQGGLRRVGSATAEQAVSEEVANDVTYALTDVADYSRCINLARTVDYAGPFTLVATTPNAPWDGLTVQRDLLLPFAG